MVVLKILQNFLPIRNYKKISKPFLNKNNFLLKSKFPAELSRTVQSFDNFNRISHLTQYDNESLHYFSMQNKTDTLREGHQKKSFVYLLIDPRISQNLPRESGYMNKFDWWKRFLNSIFYVGKGKTSRPYAHFYDALKVYMSLKQNESQKILNEIVFPQQVSSVRINSHLTDFPYIDFPIKKKKKPQTFFSKNQKLSRILDIWNTGYGVCCLHVFHNILPIEAYTREAAIIDTLGLKHLTNNKKGNYYGPARDWTLREKRYMGIALLYRIMHIFMSEGEIQLFPNDLI